jgi:uncharacterized membrane protein YeaQ/YmgE (transglycosylase-associated protein family)
MSILAWILLGLIAGLITEKLTGERTGWVVAGNSGIAGGLLGGWLAQTVFHVDSRHTFFSLATWTPAIVGAVVVLLAVRLVTGASGRLVAGRRHLTSRH